MMKKIQDIIVVGGGIIGLSAAIAMQQRGYHVQLIDAGDLNSPDTTNARVYAISPASQQLWQQLGVWDDMIHNEAASYLHMHVWDVVTGAFIDFDARMIGSHRLGYIISEHVIKAALLRQIKALQIEIFPQCKLDDVKETDTGVRLTADQQVWCGDLLIVADGAQSFCRQCLGVALTQWSYHQHAIVATVQTEKPHHHTAYQVFLPEGPLAFLPLSSAHHCSIVWSTTANKATALMSLPEKKFNDALTKAFESHLGPCQLHSARATFPLHMRHAKKYVGGHWLLMGDAAHTVHPLAGLGLNIGLADLTAWLSQLNKANSLPRMLQSYQRDRKAHVWQAIALMDALKMLFANRLPPVVMLRKIGLQVCGRLSPLKQWMIQWVS